MTYVTDRCFTREASPLLELRQALACIEAVIRPVVGRECVSLAEAAGRVLSCDLLSRIDYPPFANAAMDGYALRSAETAEDGVTGLDVVGTARAGHPYESCVGHRECVRIFTGAVMPAGTDAVIMQEEVERDGDRLSLSRRLLPDESVRRAGRDIAAGQCVLSAGKRLTAIDTSLIATIGIPEIAVYRRPRVGMLSTGDELRPAGRTLAPGEIFDSNRFAVGELLRGWGIEVSDLGVVPDDREVLKRTLSQAAACSDAVVTIGGASVGDADHLVPALAELGTIALWKIAIKPGKPFAFGQAGACYVFGLPGNPVSAIVTLLQLVRPALLRLMGATPEPPLRLAARCRRKLVKTTDRMEFQRGVCRNENDCTLSVVALSGQDADRISALSAANCFIVLPAESHGAAEGDSVWIEPFSSFL